MTIAYGAVFHTRCTLGIKMATSCYLVWLLIKLFEGIKINISEPPVWVHVVLVLVETHLQGDISCHFMTCVSL
jgi:hypothetical protein